MFDTVAEVESFIQDFEACRLPKERWTHLAHLVAGFWYLSRHDMAQALDTVRKRIRNHNESVGTANTDSSGYHESITRLYMAAIADHIVLHRTLPFERSLSILLASPLAKSDWPLTYYTRECLFSTQARRSWVEPDLQPQRPDTLTAHREPSRELPLTGATGNVSSGIVARLKGFAYRVWTLSGS